MKKTLILIAILSQFISCKSTKTPTAEVVTTNAWTAAYALAAGATDVHVLTPYEMIHPSEYELRPSDITHLTNAEVIIYAGYEVMMQQIRTGLNIPDEKMLQIFTSYSMDEIEASVMLIASRLGTEEVAKKNIEEINKSMAEARKALAEHSLEKETAVVHFFQQSFITEAGINITSIFGPAPPEPRQILDITNTNATLIIDNAHNPAGGALKETMQNADYLLLLNFPGMYGTRTIQDVIEYNARKLVNN